MIFNTLSVFKISFLLCFTFKWYQRKQECLWLWQLELLHLINTELQVLLISMLIARFTHVSWFFSCYGSIAKTSKTKHWYNESDTHTLRLSNTHKWKRFVLICNKQVMHLFLIPLFSSLYYRNILQVIWQSHLTYWNFHKTGFTLSVQQSIHFSIFILNFYQL